MFCIYLNQPYVYEDWYSPAKHTARWEDGRTGSYVICVAG